MDSYRIFCRFIATGFGSGRSPKAPGTCGTLAALIIALFFVSFYGPPSLMIRAGIALLTTLVSFPVIGTILQSYSVTERKDPQEIVIDEFAGFYVAAAFTEWSAASLLLAFLLFRLFDISKPGPISHLEKLPGATGIILDDIGAGFFAGVTLLVLTQLLGLS